MQLRNSTTCKRSGATMVETAIVLSVTLLFLLGFIIGALGVSRYQQVAALAREGARYAIVHGAQYQKETGKPAATQTDVANYIVSKAAGLDTSKLTVTVTWNTSNWPTHDANSNPPGQAITNTVSVGVDYQWIPEAYLPSITLTSTSVMPMAY